MQLTRGDMIACARVLYTICLPIAPKNNIQYCIVHSCANSLGLRLTQNQAISVGFH